MNMEADATTQSPPPNDPPASTAPQDLPAFASEQRSAHRDDTPPGAPTVDVYMDAHDVTLTVDDQADVVHSLRLQNVRAEHAEAARAAAGQFLDHVAAAQRPGHGWSATAYTEGSDATHEALQEWVREAARERGLRLEWSEYVFNRSGLERGLGRPGMVMKFGREGVEQRIYSTRH